MVESKAFVKADTLEELVSAMGLPESTLDTIAGYNKQCDAGEDSEFHKDASLMIPVATAPFYGSVSNTSFCHAILGGLRTDDEMRVLRRRRQSYRRPVQRRKHGR